MFARLILKLTALIMGFSSSMLFAEPITSCPTQAELQTFQSVYAIPYAYSAAHQKMAYLAVRAKPPADNNSKTWVMFLNPIYAGQGEDIYEMVKSTVTHLRSVSVTPFEFRPEENEITTVQFCAYDGMRGMQAMVYYIDLDDDIDESGYVDDPNFKNKIAHHAKVKAIIQKMMVK